MLQKPLVSILIPVFNGEKFIQRAVNSCLKQTFKQIEVIVLNDGSSDQTANILNTFVDERLRILSNPQRTGIPAARNRLLKEANAPIIAWLDADDEALPQRIEYQYEAFLKNPETVLSFTFTTIVNKEKQYNTFVPTHKTLLLHMLFFKQPVVFSSCIARVIPDIAFNLRYKRCQDFDYVWEMAKKGKMDVVPKVLSKYHIMASEDKPDCEITEAVLCEIQLQKLKEIGLEMTEKDAALITRFFRNNKDCTKPQLRNALQLLHEIMLFIKTNNTRLSHKYMRAIYSYQVLKTAYFHGPWALQYFKKTKLNLIWMLTKAKF